MNATNETRERKPLARIQRALGLAALLAALACGSGCAVLLVGAAAGAGAAGVAYYKGSLKGHVKTDPKSVAAATESAFEAMEIVKVSSKSSKLDAEVIGRTADDTKIEVNAEAKEGGGSELSIRVGVFGDEPMSRKIYHEIEKRLPMGE